ncbi:MAG: hypothetical protein NWF08_00305 [Candidatus Bathyarchaeota archaeon]|nr:hypothetical protein [Candidatus Bathyarchaeota archaeon]
MSTAIKLDRNINDLILRIVTSNVSNKTIPVMKKGIRNSGFQTFWYVRSLDMRANLSANEDMRRLTTIIKTLRASNIFLSPITH